ncbi:hypothetical protein TNCV_3621591 [Trichonephila clavipes]|nr:hypothetical protein TNCV_3621591 [Trichonephila clavipes]
MPETAVRKNSRSLELCPYRLQLLQALKLTDYDLRTKFASDILMHTNENFMDYVIFSDESTFQLNGYVNNNNVRIWSLENTTRSWNCNETPKLKICVPYLGGNRMGLSFYQNQL